jgi:rare lipoprotein A
MTFPARPSALGLALALSTLLLWSGAPVAAAEPPSAGAGASTVAAAPTKPAQRHRETGQASWYGTHHRMKRTASGERFDPDALTAAHPSLPLHTRVKVRNLSNQREVTVIVNDRSQRMGKRIIDLSPRAAEILDMKEKGVVPVVIETQPDPPRRR